MASFFELTRRLRLWFVRRALQRNKLYKSYTKRLNNLIAVVQFAAFLQYFAIIIIYDEIMLNSTKRRK